VHVVGGGHHVTSPSEKVLGVRGLGTRMGQHHHSETLRVDVLDVVDGFGADLASDRTSNLGPLIVNADPPTGQGQSADGS